MEAFMPVTFNFVEPGIYRVCWIGHVLIEEPIREMDALMELVTARGDTSYVMILDLTEVTQIPFDLNNLTRVAKQDSRVVAYVIVRASRIAEVMAKMVNQVSKRSFHFVNSLDAAVEKSRSLLRKMPQEAGK